MEASEVSRAITRLTRLDELYRMVPEVQNYGLPAQKKCIRPVLIANDKPYFPTLCLLAKHSLPKDVYTRIYSYILVERVSTVYTKY